MKEEEMKRQGLSILTDTLTQIFQQHAHSLNQIQLKKKFVHLMLTSLPVILNNTLSPTFQTEWEFAARFSTL